MNVLKVLCEAADVVIAKGLHKAIHDGGRAFAVSVILQKCYELLLVDADEASHTALTDAPFAVACHTVTGDALEGGRFVVEQRIRGGMTRVAQTEAGKAESYTQQVVHKIYDRLR